MEIQGQVQIEARKEEVWAILNDKEVLAKITPGCKALEETAPDYFEARLSLGIAAVRGDYEATLQIADKSAPDTYRMLIKGSGKPGFIEADVKVDLEESGGQTCLQYAGTAQVGGLIAGVGQRILSGVAKMIIKDFFKKLQKELVGGK